MTRLRQPTRRPRRFERWLLLARRVTSPRVSSPTFNMAR